MDASIAKHPVGAISEAVSDRLVPIPARLWGRLTDAWLRRMDVHVARDVQALDHSGVLADFERAARG